jgi:hypothetical protein
MAVSFGSLSLSDSTADDDSCKNWNQTDIIINDLKEKVDDSAVKWMHALEELQNVQRTLIKKNADLEELLKNRDAEILKLKEEVSTVSFSKTNAEIITRDEKILELEDHLSKISNKSTPNLSDMELLIKTFNNARESDTAIFRECVGKLSRNVDKIAKSSSSIEDIIERFSGTNIEQMEELLRKIKR